MAAKPDRQAASAIFSIPLLDIAIPSYPSRLSRRRITAQVDHAPT
jgi:hypothetical protein